MKTLQEAAKQALSGKSLVKESARHELKIDPANCLAKFDGFTASTAKFTWARSARTYDIYKSSNIPVPSVFSTLFKEIWVECEVNNQGHVKEAGDSFTYSFNWRYEHPRGGTNGLSIGTVFVDKESGSIKHVRKEGQ